jgi:hypothetical protein
MATAPFIRQHHEGDPAPAQQLYGGLGYLRMTVRRGVANEIKEVSFQSWLDVWRHPVQALAGFSVVDIMAFLYIFRQYFMLRHGAFPLLNAPASQFLDYLQHLDIQVTFASYIAAAAKGALPQSIHELRGEFQLTIQLSQGGV